MSDVDIARAPWPLRWLLVLILFVAAHRPVIMTARKRNSLVYGAEGMDRAMKLIYKLQVKIAELGGDDLIIAPAPVRKCEESEPALMVEVNYDCPVCGQPGRTCIGPFKQCEYYPDIPASPAAKTEAANPGARTLEEAQIATVQSGLIRAWELISEKYGTWSPEEGYQFPDRYSAEAIAGINCAREQIAEAATLREQLIKIQTERDEAWSELNDAALARDEVGYLGSVADCIRGLNEDTIRLCRQKGDQFQRAITAEARAKAAEAERDAALTRIEQIHTRVDKEGEAAANATVANAGLRKQLAAAEAETKRTKNLAESWRATAEAEAEIGNERQAEVARCREALVPFGQCWKPYLAAYDPRGCPGWPSMGTVSIADLKRAHDLIEGLPATQVETSSSAADDLLAEFWKADAERVRTIEVYNAELTNQKQRGIFPVKVDAEYAAMDAAGKAWWAVVKTMQAVNPTMSSTT